MIVIGVILLIAGIALYAYGNYLNNDIELQFKSLMENGTANPGSELITIGIVVALVGVVLIIVGCIRKKGRTPPANTTISNNYYGGVNGIKVYSGYSYNLAYRIEGTNIYAGYGYDVAYRIDGNNIYFGLSYDLAYRIDGNNIYSGYSYDVAFRIDGKNIYYGYGYDLAYRIE